VRTEVLGNEGALLIGGLQRTPLSVLTPLGVTHDVFPWFPERFADAYLSEIRHFVQCVRADEFPSPDGRDDRAALQVALAATGSLPSGIIVTLPQEKPVGRASLVSLSLAPYTTSRHVALCFLQGKYRTSSIVC